MSTERHKPAIARELALSVLTAEKRGLLDALTSIEEPVLLQFPELLPIPDIMFIQHPDDIKAIWVGHQDKLNKVGMPYDTMRRIMGDGLFTMETDERWKYHQRLMGPHLQPRSIHGLPDRIHGHVIRSLNSQTQGTMIEIDDLHVFSKTISLQLVTEAIFGTTLPEPQARRIADAFSAINTFFDTNMRLATVPAWMFARIPILFPAVRHGQATITDAANDLLDTQDAPVLNALRSPDNGLSRQEQIDEVITLFAAGHGTTASATSWALYLLGRPEHAHITSALARRLQEHDSFEVAIRDPYLDSVWKEVLRMYPPVYATTRTAIASFDVTTSTGTHHIHEGNIVVLSPYLTHHDPRLWPDPDEFSPNRHADRQQYEETQLIPFGIGQRGCIGEHLGNAIGKSVIATILRSYIPFSLREAKPLFSSTLKMSRNVPYILLKRPA